MSFIWNLFTPVVSVLAAIDIGIIYYAYCDYCNLIQEMDDWGRRLKIISDITISIEHCAQELTYYQYSFGRKGPLHVRIIQLKQLLYCLEADLHVYSYEELLEIQNNLNSFQDVLRDMRVIHKAHLRRYGFTKNEIADF